MKDTAFRDVAQGFFFQL